MSDTYRTAGVEDIHQSAVSWGAIFAGGFAAAALTVVLIAFGTGVGLATVSPWANSGISATTFKWSAGLYLVVVAMLASTVGGYMAGRLRTKWTGAGADEVTFRDTAHGFLAWAFATVAGVLVLGAATTALLGGAAAGLGAGASAQAAPASTSNDYFADMLLRAPPGAASPTAQTDPAGQRREVVTIFTRGFAESGDIAPADRAQLAQIVAARTGLSPADAEKRVSEVVTQAKTAIDKARKFTSSLAMWLTLSMFLGAFAASAAAIEGGQLRDGRWKGIIGDRQRRVTVS